MNTETQAAPAAEKVERIVRGYMHSIERINPRVLWTRSGFARMASILGWIYAQPDPEVREKLATEIVRRFENMTHDEEIEWRGSKYPAQRCVVSDDGTLHGFSLCWYALCKKDVVLEKTPDEQAKYKWWTRYTHDAEESRHGYDAMPYAFMYNGGLLWHGPGDNSLAVVLDRGDNFWSIHT